MDEVWDEPDAPTYPDEGAAPPPPAATFSPIDAYRKALEALDINSLRALGAAARLDTAAISNRRDVASAITDRLAEPGVAASLMEGLPFGPRAAMGLFALTESRPWPAQGLYHALRCLSIEPTSAVAELQERGLLAVGHGTEGLAVPQASRARVDLTDSPNAFVIPHPSAASASRPVVPDGAAIPRTEVVRLERESDGLEPILRLAVVWQRVAEAPLRQTQNGAFYKRDRERLEDDPAVAGPISDALEPLPDMPALWLSLARGVGLLGSEPGSDRVTAAPADFWVENAYHLPQMVSARWLSLWDWHEQGGVQQEGAEILLAFPFTRASVLLLLASLGADEWVTTEDLSDFLRGRDPTWDRPAFQGPSNLADVGPGRPAPRRGKSRQADPTSGAAALDAMLLGMAYQLGLVRTAEAVPSGRRAVRLSELGRYLLALGPPPKSRTEFDHFLFVQPSFEVIAYRQGLNPALIGRFSRFTRWTQVGAALALTLTPESVYRGLESGMTPKAMLDELQKHSPRPLPAGVAEALRSWSGRRDRVSYHGSATLVEFVTPDDLEAALAGWPEAPDRPAPVRVTDRLLLVEDDRTIPFQRFRLTGSRNYRNPAEACVEVAADGVTLTLDPARSDLLVDAELGRFAEERAPITVAVPGYGGQPGVNQPRRRFVVTSESLARSATLGLTAGVLSQWFVKRTGSPTPPALRLILAASSATVPAFRAARQLVLRTPTAELLDGLFQHPATFDYLGERLGPDAVIISEPLVAGLKAALESLGLAMEVGGA